MHHLYDADSRYVEIDVSSIKLFSSGLIADFLNCIPNLFRKYMFMITQLKVVRNSPKFIHEVAALERRFTRFTRK